MVNRKNTKQHATDKGSQRRHEQAAESEHCPIYEQKQLPVVVVLKHDSFVFQKITDDSIIDWNGLSGEKPADVSEPESSVNIVGIFLRVHVAVVDAVVIGPAQGGHLTREHRHYEPKPFVERVRVISFVGKQSMIGGSNREPREDKSHEVDNESREVEIANNEW